MGIESSVPFILEIAFIAVLGLCFGSFASAISYRVPRGESWIKKGSARNKAARSKCPSCHAELKWAELIPFVSWLWLQGKCRSCGARISTRYPLLELASLVCCLLVYFYWGLSAPGLIIMLSVPFLLALLVIDLDHMILPDQLVAICGGLGIGFIIFMASEMDEGRKNFLLSHIGGLLLFPAFMFGLAYLLKRILKKDALGLGDIKFFGVAGLWLGAGAFPLYLIMTGLLGMLAALFSFLIQKKKTIFPFGPALISALFILLLEASRS